MFDPKLPPGRAGLERAKGPFREVLVFGLGGGNYAEREALAAWAQRATPQRQVRVCGWRVWGGEGCLRGGRAGSVPRCR